jgi:gluconate 2-dehydrogenase gamma chain
MSDDLMQRREILRRVAFVLGGAVSAPAALAFLQGCSAKEAPGGETTASWAPKFLTGHEALIVSAIASTIIPSSSGSSGATEAGVGAFIDSALAAVYPKEDQDRFKAGIPEFESAAKTAKGKPFFDQMPGEREEFLKEYLGKALEGERDPRPFILMARELTLLGFYSSKVGITENMEYVAVPTAYHGCVPLSEMKKHVYWE